MRAGDLVSLGELATQHLRRYATQRVGFLDFLVSPVFCDLHLSPLMTAVAGASEGAPVSGSLSAYFGREVPRRAAPRTVAVRAGGRAGKTSRLLAPKALHAAWTTPLPTLQHGEVASALIVAPDMKLARQALSFVVGYADRSPVMRDAIVGKPTTDSVTLERPDGKRVRVEVLAATRGGRAVRARTLVFAGMDEAAFFYAEGTGVVNDQDVYDAVYPRVVPGGQVWVVSTPWLKGIGLLETLIEAGSTDAALAVSAGTRPLNPTWDPDGRIEREMRAADPEKAAREIDGVPLSGSAASFFEPDAIDRAVDRALTVPRRAAPGEQITAGGDFAFRRDSAALAVVHRDGRTMRVGDLYELRPVQGAPLKPSDTVRAFAARLLTHAGLQYLVADGHYRETVYEFLSESGLSFKLAPASPADAFIKARAAFREGLVRIPNHPRLIAQLKSVRGRENPGGGMSIMLPRDGTGHCDLVSALVLALWESGGLTAPLPEPKLGTAEYGKAIEDKLERAIDDSMAREEFEEREARW
jgi:hypothetical protein